MIVVLSWVAIVGLIALAIYCGIQWSDANHHYTIAKEENDHVVGEWQKLNETARGLETNIKDKKNEFIAINGTLQKLQDEYKAMTEAYLKLQEQLAKVNADLEAMIKERDKYKDDNEKLKKSNALALEEITKKTKLIEELKHEMITDQEEEKIFFWSGIGASAVCAYNLIDYIITDLALAKLEDELAKLRPFMGAFRGVSQGYENYELLIWKKKQSVKRETCFKGVVKSNLDKCNEKAPTITTVTTSDGIQFGAVLFEKWTTNAGEHEDKNAYTFSDTLAQVTTIADSKKAMIVEASKLVEFGDGDIAINADGSKGSSYARTYKVPLPYKNDNFYYNDTQYNVGEVRIDVVSLA